MSFDWEEETPTTNAPTNTFSEFDFEEPNTTSIDNSSNLNSTFDTPAPTSSSNDNAIYQWRLEQEDKLKKLDQQLEDQKRKIIEDAKKEREELYKKREEAKQNESQKRKQHEEDLIKKRDNLLKSENPWDRVSAFVDFKAVAVGEKDTSRMKKIMLSMKAN